LPALEREQVALWFFDTLKSTHADGDLATGIQRYAKAHERRSSGSRGSRPQGDLEEVNCYGRIGLQQPGNSGLQ
jgi:hypothetical protein